MKKELEKTNALIVKLQDYKVGVINRLAGGRHLFSFDEDYINDPHRPILSLSYKGLKGGLVSSTRIYNLRLPPFFSNLLPEGHLRAYLAKRAEVKPEQEFFLLAALGSDLPGAVLVTPEESSVIDDEVVQQKNKKNLNDTLLKFSLAGVQLKFSAIMETSGGLTIPADGRGGSWIVKLPSAQFEAVPENEFVMLALAKAIGIELPKNYLLDTNEIEGLPKDSQYIAGKVLAVERFDRKENQRIHMEDFAQIFGQYPEGKYENQSYANIAAVLWAEIGEEAAYEFVRRLVFSILIGNADMHLKNWSLLYPDTRLPVLSPAYDLVSTIPYIQDDHLALNFGDSRSLKEITVDQLRRFAEVARMPVSPLSQLVRDTIEKTISEWSKLTEKDLLPKKILTEIDQQIHSTAKNSKHL